MPIIALMNQKGGVGKTTTTVNLGAALAEAGKRICLIDLDPQAHLTINYGVDPSDQTVTMYDVLVEDRSFLEAVHKIDDNVALVPSTIDLAAAEIQLVSVVGRETLLKEKIEVVQHDFDYILIDCPPSLGILTINALSVADEVIIPMQAHFLALQGVAKLLETVQLVNRRVNPKLQVCGIVLTMFDAQTKLSSEVVAELQGFIEQAKGKPLPWANARVFKTRIRRNIKLAESPSFGQTILNYDGASNGAMDYRLLAREVMAAHGETPPPMPVVRMAVQRAVATPAASSKPAPVIAVPAASTPAPLSLVPPPKKPFGVGPAASATRPVAPPTLAATSAKTQAAPAPAARPMVPPAKAPAPKPSHPQVSVTISPALDASKRAARPTPAPPVPNPAQEVA